MSKEALFMLSIATVSVRHEAETIAYLELLYRRILSNVSRKLAYKKPV